MVSLAFYTYKKTNREDEDMKKRIVTVMLWILGLVFAFSAGSEFASSAVAEGISFTPDSNGIIHLSEEQSRRYLGIEKGSYLRIPETNFQILSSENLQISEADGEEGHVMTVSINTQDAGVLSADVYALSEMPLPELAPGASYEAFEINGIMYIGIRYRQEDKYIWEIWSNLDGKQCSITGTTDMDESYLAALMGLFSPAGFAGNSNSAVSSEAAAAETGKVSEFSIGNGKQGVDENALASTTFRMMQYEQTGFSVPTPVGTCSAGEWKSKVLALTDQKTGKTLYSILRHYIENPESDGSVIGIGYSVTHEEPRISRAIQKMSLESSKQSFLQTFSKYGLDTTYIDIEDHPALITFGYSADNGGSYLGTIDYIRNNEHLNFTLTSSASVGTLSMDDIIALARSITFDESLAPFRESQVSPIISSKNDDYTAVAGQSLKLTAAFGDPDFVRKEGKNRISWLVGSSFDEETTQLIKTADATISKNGVLSVSSNIDAPRTVYVVAVADSYQTFDVKEITLMPRVTKVLVDPDNVSLFVAEGQEAKVSVSLEPASVPVTNLTWTASAKNIAELEDHGDGTATIRPLKAGRMVVNVKEKGGRTGRVSVTVKQPVESLELSEKGNVIPGRTVTVNAKISPKNATDKKLIWTLDVDESIATITGNGQVRINKSAPVGTVITVTCTAEGAPEPVTATYQLEVVEK